MLFGGKYAEGNRVKGKKCGKKDKVKMAAKRLVKKSANGTIAMANKRCAV
jgi:hypothetical protein